MAELLSLKVCNIRDQKVFEQSQKRSLPWLLACKTKYRFDRYFYSVNQIGVTDQKWEKVGVQCLFYYLIFVLYYLDTLPLLGAFLAKYRTILMHKEGIKESARNIISCWQNKYKCYTRSRNWSGSNINTTLNITCSLFKCLINLEQKKGVFFFKKKGENC